MDLGQLAAGRMAAEGMAAGRTAESEEGNSAVGAGHQGAQVGVVASESRRGSSLGRSSSAGRRGRGRRARLVQERTSQGRSIRDMGRCKQAAKEGSLAEEGGREEARVDDSRSRKKVGTEAGSGRPSSMTL